MSLSSISRTVAATLAACAATAALAQSADVGSWHGDQHLHDRHVLLISIDGMHAVDLKTCVASGTCPNLAALAASGVNYTRASTSKPSDSFPGLMSMVTGASPKLMGVYYDVAYDRVLAPPMADTGNGLTHGNCVAGEQNASAIGLGQIIYGPQLALMFDQPGLPSEGGDPRTPDIIVTPNVGVVYTGSTKKQAEHGGFALDDTNVMLVVSNPRLHARAVSGAVETAQVAPTILESLGLDPRRLDGVRKEGTPALPGLDLED